MHDVLVEGSVALLEVVTLPTDASLPAEAQVWSHSGHLTCNLTATCPNPMWDEAVSMPHRVTANAGVRRSHT